MLKSKKKKKGISEKIRASKANLIHLTHNDLDAVGSDAIHRLAYGNENVYTIWASVGAFPFLFEEISELPANGRTLSITDLTFKNGMISSLKRAKENGWIINWRDHHRWTNDGISDVRRLVHSITISTNQCACAICAQDLLPNKPLAREIAHVVCDYDLWNHTHPQSQLLGIVLQRHKNREYVRDLLMTGVFEDEYIRQEFSSIMKEVEQAKVTCEKEMKIYGKDVKIIITRMHGFPSETADYLRSKYGSDIEVLVSANGKFSIRSKQPVSHLIAREFHGGGHPEASGGHFQFTWFDTLKLKLCKKNRHYDSIAQKSHEILSK
ncbi:MAG: phosphoesterase [Methanomicrobiales archaeon]|nr:phosphoesterase [Methanomicrobiales archaeon]